MQKSSEFDRSDGARERDRPWLIRTYSGHSSAAASNALYKMNLEKGQTGLSVAFDLPTQTGYDSDHELARGEVGKVGVPIGHLGDMRALFDKIPLDRMNTSMTINATGAWLLSLYVALAKEQGVAPAALSGTVQNDIMKEYLSRGTYIFPPGPSLRLITDIASYTYKEIPKWNPMNVCSYHLQEAVRDSGQVSAADFPQVVGRISFFVNAGLKFITEMCKMRAFVELWDELTAERYGIEDSKYRRFRYGVQVNSLGLTEQQPENNVYRILLEMLAVVLSKDARARSVQLPAWNEALGLPRPWDQQWSLRLQQIVAHETDLLDYDDIFYGSPVIEEKVEQLKAETKDELARIEAMGGAVAAIESSYMKEQLVASNAARMAAIESGEQIVVGVNAFTETAPSPLTTGVNEQILTVDEGAETAQIESLKAWRSKRDAKAVEKALADLRAAASEGRNIMPVSIEAAEAGVTTGEWASVLREVYGEYRAPTGIGGAQGAAGAAGVKDIAELRQRVESVSEKLGRRLKILIGKPGLDGHSNGAEQIAVRARDCGMEVVYEGIRLTPAQIVNAAMEEGVHVVGLSILSGSHVSLIGDVMTRMHKAGLDDVPVVAGGIIPIEDEAKLKSLGVAGVYTPKDYQLDEIMGDIITLVEAHAA